MRSTTKFKVEGLFRGDQVSIGPNTDASITLHLKFVE